MQEAGDGTGFVTYTLCKKVAMMTSLTGIQKSPRVESVDENATDWRQDGVGRGEEKVEREKVKMAEGEIVRSYGVSN